MPAPAQATPADIRESEATGEIAAIFADIRTTQRIGNVNYIWRHLATIPGALERAWRQIKPRDGEIRSVGDEIWARAERLAEAQGIAPVVLPDPPEQVRPVLESYARGNRWNLAALTLLLDGSLPRCASEPRAESARPVQIPRLPAFDTLPEQVKATIVALARAGPAADSGIRPSLWVHLGLWPEFLVASAPRLCEVLRSKPFGDAHESLLQGSAAPTAHRDGLPAAAIHSLRQFRRRIAEMTLIGAAIGLD